MWDNEKSFLTLNKTLTTQLFTELKFDVCQLIVAEKVKMMAWHGIADRKAHKFVLLLSATKGCRCSKNPKRLKIDILIRNCILRQIELKKIKI